MQDHQPQFLQQDAGFVGLETAAVQPNVQQPVIFIVRFFGRCLGQELAVGFFPLQTEFGFECTNVIEP